MSNGAFQLKLTRTLYNNLYRAMLLDENQQVKGRISIIPNLATAREYLPADAPQVHSILLVIVEDADINKDNLLDFEERATYALLKRFSTEQVYFQQCQFLYPSPKYMEDCGNEPFPAAACKLVRTLYEDYYGTVMVDPETKTSLGSLNIVPCIPTDRSQVPEDAPVVEPYLVAIVNEVQGLSKENLLSFEETAGTYLQQRLSNPQFTFEHVEFYYPSPAFVFEQADSLSTPLN